MFRASPPPLGKFTSSPLCLVSSLLLFLPQTASPQTEADPGACESRERRVSPAPRCLIPTDSLLWWCFTYFQAGSQRRQVAATPLCMSQKRPIPCCFTSTAKSEALGLRGTLRMAPSSHLLIWDMHFFRRVTQEVSHCSALHV